MFRLTIGYDITMKVIGTFQSTMSDEPRGSWDIPWYTGDSEASVMVSVGQLIEHSKDMSHTKILSITIDMEA